MPRRARRSSSGSRAGSRPAIRRASSPSSSAPAITARARRTGRLRRRLVAGRHARARARSSRPSSASSAIRALSRLRFAGTPRRDMGGDRRHWAADPVFARPPSRWRCGMCGRRSPRDPIAFEPPSAGFALDWRMLAALRRARRRLRHADPCRGHFFDRRSRLSTQQLPFDEPFRIPDETAAAIARAKAAGGRVIAIGTTVVRALEAAADGHVLRACRRWRRHRTHRADIAAEASSTPSSPASTRRARATSSCFAPSPTTTPSTAVADAAVGARLPQSRVRRFRADRADADGGAANSLLPSTRRLLALPSLLWRLDHADDRP